MNRILYVGLSTGDRTMHEVTLLPSFEQIDAWNTVQTLAYIETRGRSFDHISFVEVCPQAPNHSAQPARGAGRFVVVSDEEFAEMMRLDDEAAAALIDKTDAYKDALEVLKSIPQAAQNELDAVNEVFARRAALANEGGEGYVPQMDWSSKVGREILAKHAMSADDVKEALDLVCSR